MRLGWPTIVSSACLVSKFDVRMGKARSRHARADFDLDYIRWT
jgi:hypothetical protein